MLRECQHASAWEFDAQLTNLSNFIAVPDGTVFTAWTVGNIVGGEAAVWSSQGALAHEISHVIDGTVLPRKLGITDPNFSNSASLPTFRNALTQDPYWASDYGRSNNINEEFAEIGRLSIYNRNVPTKLAGANINATLIGQQLSVYDTVIGDWNIRGGQCIATEKVQTSRPVRRDGTVARSVAAGPDVSDTGSVLPVITGPIYRCAV